MKIQNLIFLSALLLGTASAAPLTVTFLHNNDVHSHLEPTKVGDHLYGGHARQTTLIRQAQASMPNPVVLSAGDAIQGTLSYNVYKGISDALLMNWMGYQAMTIGNHEFDDGPANLANFAKRAKFPLLSANLDVSNEPLLKDYVKPYTILKVGGDRIGLIGATVPELPLISSPGKNIKMLDLNASLNAAVKALTAQGVNKIVFLSHIGYTDDLKVAASVPGIDVIIGGHSHTLLGTFDNKDLPKAEGAYPTVVQNVDGNRTLVATAWEWGKVLGELQVTFDDAGAVQSWQGQPLLVTNDIAEEDTARRMVSTLSVPITNLRQQVIGSTSTGLNGAREIVRKRESTMANVIADATLIAAQNAGADLALVNGGGVRASIDKGPISFEEAITVQPFGNMLSVMQISGADLRAALEYGVATWADGKGQFLHVSKNMSYTFDLSKPVGSRVTNVTFNGQPLDPTRMFKVAVNNFTAGGGDGFTMFAKAPRLDTGILDIDILVNYLKAHPDISAQNEGRIVILNEPGK